MIGAGGSATGGAGSGAGGAGTAGEAIGGTSTGAAGSGGLGGAGTTGGRAAGGRQQGGAAGSPGGTSSMGGNGAGGATQSTGCGHMPTLKNSTSNSNPSAITISVSGTNREYAIRWPSDYDNTHPYRLILDLHGYGGSYKETAGENYFGLWTPSMNTTIFIALSAISTDWRNGDNLAYVDAVLKAVEADLCIDTSRVMLEGFSQGAAEVWQLACSRPGVFRAAVGHSGGGVTNPTSCMPIPYLGSGGLQESVTQTTQTDQFAKWNGCTVTTLPKAPTGGHVCTNYTGCPTADPVRWCNYDGPHTPLPTDSGSSSSWMPSETWPFFSQF
jgi:poly(3-hydroxybutyrate) depolymerase